MYLGRKKSKTKTVMSMINDRGDGDENGDENDDDNDDHGDSVIHFVSKSHSQSVR